MKNLALVFGRLAIVTAGALSLGACSRADYTTTARATDQPLTVSVATPAAPSQAAPYVPVATEESAVVKAAPASPVAVASTLPTPATAKPAVATASAASVEAAPIAAKPASKLTLVQRLAFRKITKKLDKLTAQMPQLKKQDASAARGGLDSNLRSAILFGLVGLIVLLFSGVSNIFAIVGTILLIIGLVFLVLWLLDQA